LFRIPLVVEEYSLDSVILDLLIPERKLPSGLKIPFGTGAVILTPGWLIIFFFVFFLYSFHNFLLSRLPFFAFSLLFLLIFSPLSSGFLIRTHKQQKWTYLCANDTLCPK
jgi:hypothetical protein|tara:strand:- start:92 stop:421 length:330 start_codon:yes stop_codon:yes gene_type:complete